MTGDLRLAWQLVRGSGRREGWRVALTGVGALLATGLALAAVAVVSLRGRRPVPFANGLLDRPGERQGIVVGLLLLLVPAFGFLGQCARIGAVHRDRRLARLRLAGASPGQVRRIAAAETGLTCLAGSALAAACCAVLVRTRWPDAPATAWAGFAVVLLAVPALGALVSVLALRRVVASPLGTVRRVRPRGRAVPVFLAVLLLSVAVAGLSYAVTHDGRSPGGPGSSPALVLPLVVPAGALVLWLAGATARLTGRVLAGRTDRPAVLIAAERLREDPWAQARTHAAVLLATVAGTAFVGVREALLDSLPVANRSFYTTGIGLTTAAFGVALAITLSGLAVGTAESVAARRGGLAAQAAAGVPHQVLGRAMLLETALPLAPTVLVAGVAGMAIGSGYALVAGGGSLPWAALLVPVGVYACCLLAAATALPLLRRTAHPAELRHM
ncbi:ABC transporter permease [Streptomyces sp. NPDC005925]|uniref:ABC transporter permease n=1 Tax=Streptomyces sp. NPDC005925 TaxID=3157172 RepID=UPI0033DF2C18